MEKLSDMPGVKQFIAYFFVGGAAAVVEWVMFFIFAGVIHINYMISTCLAFIFSATANWMFGRLWAFKGNEKYRNKRRTELFLVFGANAIGLLMNMALMYLLVSIAGMNTDLRRTESKIIATGIVFIWNFLIRKFVIYK